MAHTNPRLQVIFGFIFSLILTLTFPLIFPSYKLAFFPSFLVMSFYKIPFRSALSWGIVAGLIMDLLSPYSHLGIYALNFAATITILYSRKQNFFPESLSTIPSLTFLFSLLSTALQACLLYLFETGIQVSISWITIDLFLFATLDAACGFALFTLIPFFMPKVQKRDYLLSSIKIKNPSL